MGAEQEETALGIAGQLRDSHVTEIRVVFLDYNGIPRGRSVGIESLARALTRGINFSSPTVDFNSRDQFPPTAVFDLASADFWARADPASYHTVPSRDHVAEMFADLVDADGVPWPGCPRAALRRVADQAAAWGLRFNLGFEPEGYLLRRTDAGPDLASPLGFATLDGLEQHGDFMRDLLDRLGKVHLEVEQWSKEYGPGQIEVNIRHHEPLEAADHLVMFKEIFRELAREHGMIGTFMPKPFGDQAGSGLHVHVSASPPTAGPFRNLFEDEADLEHGLSVLGRHALGGLLAHGEALTALGATTVNSYKRFIPGSWAPTHVMYAYSSRASFVRVPEKQTARRLELRVGDPACNPYLFATGILAAMLDGAQRELDPGPPMPGNVGLIGDAEAAARGLKRVPRTLAQALDALEQDEVIRKALGPLIVEEFIKVKRSEWEAFCSHVGQWDRDWYLERY